MENDMLISVIVPVFNALPYLIETLESIVDQTYQNIEVIVIDDGSTDGSGDICDSFAERDKRIIVLHQCNKGLSAARNLGLDLMHGEVVAFIDSDDACDRDYLRKMVECIEQNQADVCICKYIDLYTIDRLMPCSKKKKNPPGLTGVYTKDDALRALVEGNINHGVWNKLYRSWLWKDVRFPECHVYEEIASTYRIISLCNSIVIIDDALYYHRLRQGSISLTYTKSNTADWIESFSKFDEFVKNLDTVFSREHVKKNMQTRFSNILIAYINHSKISQNEDGLFWNDLRKEIIELGKTIEIVGFRKKISYFVVCSCPKLLKVLCAIYYPIRHSIRRRTK